MTSSITMAWPFQLTRVRQERRDALENDGACFIKRLHHHVGIGFASEYGRVGFLQVRCGVHNQLQLVPVELVRYLHVSS